MKRRQKQRKVPRIECSGKYCGKMDRRNQAVSGIPVIDRKLIDILIDHIEVFEVGISKSY